MMKVKAIFGMFRNWGLLIPLGITLMFIPLLFAGGHGVWVGGKPNFFVRLWIELTHRPLDFFLEVLFYGGSVLLVMTVAVNLVRLMARWIASIE